MKDRQNQNAPYAKRFAMEKAKPCFLWLPLALPKLEDRPKLCIRLADLIRPCFRFASVGYSVADSS